MPNRQAPTPEEANKLFQQYPDKLLREWADEWGISVERVRQIRHEAGVGAVFKINYDIVDIVADRISNGEYTLTNRAMYKDLSVSYDAFARWVREDIDVAQKIHEAQEKYRQIKLNPENKTCPLCKLNQPVDKFSKTQKYLDGYNKFCIRCVESMKNDKPTVKERKECIMCKKEKSVGSFDRNSYFCKDCKSKGRRKVRARNLKYN